jgi:nucleoside-diphosphate-sugar epimerase
MASSSKPLVLLTGGSGFIGAHVLDLLLKSNYQVRCVARSARTAQFLESQYSSHAADVSSIVVPDIQAPNVLDDAMKDVDFILHLASPFFIVSDDPLKDLIEPAVNVTKNVVASALNSPNSRLKRLVITSSLAAILDPFKGPAQAGYTYTEKDWSPVTLEQGQKSGGLGYFASKRFAEQAAWEMWSSAKPDWDLVAINPCTVYGPPIQEIDPAKGIDGLNTSVRDLLRGILGMDPKFKPKVTTPAVPAWVDVRNVALAHVNALSLPKGISERFLVCDGVDNFEDGLDELRRWGGDAWLGEPGEKLDRTKTYAVDSSRSRELLGLKAAPFGRMIEEVLERMKAVGMLSNVQLKL